MSEVGRWSELPSTQGSATPTSDVAESTSLSRVALLASPLGPQAGSRSTQEQNGESASAHQSYDVAAFAASIPAGTSEVAKAAPRLTPRDTDAKHGGATQRFRPSIISVNKARAVMKRNSIQPVGPLPAQYCEGAVAGSRSGAREGSNASVFDIMGQHPALGPRRKWLLQLREGLPFMIASCIITLIVIFMNDVRLAATAPPADPLWTILAGICLFCFAAELTLDCVVKPNFILSLYFWLDLLATLLLCLDIYQVEDAFIGDQTRADHKPSGYRVAVRVGQLIAVTRLLKVLKIVQLFRARYEKNRTSRRSSGLLPLEAPSGARRAYTPKSRVGQKLSDLTISRVVMLVLLMHFLLPLFNIGGGIYGDYPPLGTGGLELLHQLRLDEGSASLAFLATKNTLVMDAEYRLAGRETYQTLGLVVCNVTYIAPDWPNWQDDWRHYRRPDEISIRIINEGGCISEAWFDLKWQSQLQAILDILRIVMTMVLLGLGAYILNKDSERLVLRPIERMVKKVRDVSENPLAKHSMGKSRGGDEDQMETRILENSIHKICSLLAVGFGDAGAEVIGDNIKSGGDLNPMVPGHNIMAIFGFCDIRQFTDTTEVLQEDVMEFVNSIAKIVHMEVSLHGGAANKNIGDAFLLVWKFRQSSQVRSAIAAAQQSSSQARRSVLLAACAQQLGALTAAAAPAHSQDLVKREGSEHPIMGAPLLPAEQGLADKALAAFVIIHAGLKRSRRLQEYSLRPDLNSRMPGYQVKMGFGLHVGWAIEGAIGSEYKIDASYLSPNVNMASRLEAATKQFGTTLLLSGDFVALLSPAVQARVRQIDCVTVKGSVQPMGLFTYDISTEAIEAPNMAAGTDKAAGAGSSPVETFSLASYEHEFEEHPDLVRTWAVDAAFLERWAAAFAAYQAGAWGEARPLLEALKLCRRSLAGEVIEDGPSATLLRFMEGLRHVAPPDWKGFRELTDK